MEIDMEQVRKTTLKVISQVVKEGRLEENTQKAIRRKVEDAMDLETGALDEKEYKNAIKDVVQDYITNHHAGGPDQDEEDAPKKVKAKNASSSSAAQSKATKPRKPRLSAPKVKSEDTTSKKVQKGKKPARSSSIVPTSDEDEEAEVKPAASRLTKQKPAKKALKAKRVDSDDEQASGADSSSEPPAKRQKTVTPAQDKTSAAVAPSSSSPAPPPRSESQPDSSEKQGDGEKSESEMSVLEDDEPPVGKRNSKKKAEKSGGSSRGEKATKSRKRKEPAKELSKDEETIKRLKSFVVACGVRKVWSKEFKGLDNPSDQIRRLRQILADLGMTGRMSMEQAKAIREKREFAQELEDVQEFAQKMEAAGRRRAQKSSAAEEEPLDDSDVEVPQKRRVTARQSIMAFLGDEDESE